jgi:membrane-associated phospholipid phosphatase
MTTTVEATRPATRADFPTDPLLWLVVVGLAAFELAAMLAQGWSLEWRGIGFAVGAVLFFLAVGRIADQTGRSPAIARAGYAVALFLAMSHVALALTYVLGFVGGPFHDDALWRADSLLGFSWLAWTAWLTAHPALHALCSWIYPQIILAALVVTFILAMETEDGATRLLRAVALSFGVTLLGMLGYPAVGNDLTDPAIPIRLSLQAGTFRRYDLAQATGLITMPSFHAVLATLILLGCWPFRWLRWPAVAYSLVMLVATITAGGHYLVDVLAGIVVALGSAWLVGMPVMLSAASPPEARGTLAPRRPRRPYPRRPAGRT